MRACFVLGRTPLLGANIDEPRTMPNSRLLISGVLALTTAAGAFAQGAVKPTLVGTFSKWTMWSYTGSFSGKGEGKVCYI